MAKRNRINAPQWNLEFGLWTLSKILKNLLFYAECPHPDPLPDGWRDSMWSSLEDGARLAIDAAEAIEPAGLLRNTPIADMCKSALREGKAFARFLADKPALSVVPVEEWTVPAYQRKYDDLDAIRRKVEEFRQAADAMSVLPVPSPVPEEVAEKAQGAETLRNPENSSGVRSREVGAFIEYYRRTKTPNLSDNEVARRFAKSRTKFMEVNRAINILRQVREKHREKLTR